MSKPDIFTHGRRQGGLYIVIGGGGGGGGRGGGGEILIPHSSVATPVMYVKVQSSYLRTCLKL